MSDFTNKQGGTLPPPIEPIKFVPGTNVQEQITFVANKCNESINRWNQIQAKCYEAMNEAVGACVSNDVYYGPKEVDFQSGYSEDDSCPYHFVDVAPTDRGGKPIHVSLALAYNNTTNSGNVQSIEDVSFANNSNVIMTAVTPAQTGWSGTAMLHGELISTTEVEGQYVAGFNKNGVLKIFDSGVTYETMCQNRMFDVIGPVTPVIINGEITEAAQALTTKAAIQAMGYKSGSGHRIFFNCGAQEDEGMQGITVANILKNMGCTTAVITCLMTPDEGSGTAVGGMEFVGRLTDVPLGWQIPHNVAYWQVSRRPFPAWKNRFEAEIADLVQSYGQAWNDIQSIGNRITIAEEDIDNLEARMDQAEADIDALEELTQNHEGRITQLETEMDAAEARLDSLETRMDAAEADIDDLQERMTTAEGEIDQLQEDLAQEIQDRTEADQALSDRIDQEVTDRTNADNALSSRIDQEIADRTAADAELQIAINDEAIARAQADLELSRQIQDEVNARIEQDEYLQEQINTIKDDVDTIEETIDNIESGTLELPYVKKAGDSMQGNLDMEMHQIVNVTTLGLGDDKLLGNASIDTEEGVSLNGGQDGFAHLYGGGATVLLKDGAVSVEENQIKNVAAGTEDTDAVNVAQLNAAVAGSTEYTAGDGIDINDHVISVDDSVLRDGDLTNLESRMDAVESELDELGERVTNVEGDITNIQGDITNINQSIENIVDGTTPIDLPIATTETVGVIKVGANLTVEEDGTLNATGGGGGAVYTAGDGIDITGNVISVDDTIARQSELDELETTVAGKADQTDVDAIGERVDTVESELDSKADASQLGDYLPLAGGTMTGAIEMSANKITGVADGTETTDAVNLGQLNSGLETKADQTDLDSLELRVETNETNITNIVNGTTDLPYASDDDLSALESQIAGKADASDLENYLPLSGGTMSGIISMGSNRIRSLAAGTTSTDAVNLSQLNALQSEVDNLKEEGLVVAVSNSYYFPPGITGSMTVPSNITFILLSMFDETNRALYLITPQAFSSGTFSAGTSSSVIYDYSSRMLEYSTGLGVTYNHVSLIFF